MKIFKDTEREYKGFLIQGRTIVTSGGWVLGGRHYKEGGLKRNYNVRWPNGSLLWAKDTVIATLKDAQDQIDDYLKRTSLT